MSNRAPYLFQIDELVKESKIKPIGKRLFAVLEPLTVEVSWRKRDKKYRQKRKLKPGIVLQGRWRVLTVEEREDWKDLLPVERKAKHLEEFSKGRFMVLIVEQIKDLRAAARRSLRHIPGNLIARKVEVEKGKTMLLAGDVQIIKKCSNIIDSIVAEFLQAKKVSPKITKGTIVKLEKISTSLKNTMVDIELQVFIHIKKAEFYLEIMQDMETKTRFCFTRLTQLAINLQKLILENQLTPEQLIKIAGEAKGISLYLEKEILFEPYYSRVHSREIRSLQKTVKHARADKEETVLNSFKRAIAKLEAIAIGERPDETELKQKGGMLSQ